MNRHDQLADRLRTEIGRNTEPHDDTWHEIIRRAYSADREERVPSRRGIAVVAAVVVIAAASAAAFWMMRAPDSGLEVRADGDPPASEGGIGLPPSSSPGAGAEKPGRERSIDFSSLTHLEYGEPSELIRQSYVVAKGRFSPEPVVYATEEDLEEGISVAHLAWKFTPNEVYRDVRSPESDGRQVSDSTGHIWVTFTGNRIAELRGEHSFDAFVDRHISEANLNSVITDREVYVFLAPGSVPSETADARPDLANVMVFTNTASCYEVEDLSRNCMYVADEPGGPMLARIAPTLAPDGLARTTIETSGDLPEVYDYGIAGQRIDADRYTSVGPIPQSD